MILETVLPVVLSIIAGFFIGCFVPFSPLWIKINDNIVKWGIFFLVFVMGIGIGANRELISNIGSMGIKALVFNVITLIISAAAGILMQKLFFRRKGE